MLSEGAKSSNPGGLSVSVSLLLHFLAQCIGKTDWQILSSKKSNEICKLQKAANSVISVLTIILSYTPRIIVGRLFLVGLSHLIRHG